jgi:hypothetical protein
MSNNTCLKKHSEAKIRTSWTKQVHLFHVFNFKFFEKIQFEKVGELTNWPRGPHPQEDKFTS